MARRRFRKLMAGLLAMVMTVQSVGSLVPMEAKAAETEIVFHDFEGEGTLTTNGSGSLTTDEKYSGEQGMLYSKEGAYTGWNVEVEGKNGTVDVSDMEYITFWLKDSGTNNLAVKLIDTSGANSEVWTSMNAVAGEWTLFSVPLADFSGIDKTAIKTVALYEWNDGTYYVDDIKFVKALPTDDIVFHDFEGSVSCNDAGVLTTDDKYSGEQSLLYTKNDADNKWAVDIESKNGVLDVSEMKYITLWLKDTGANSIAVKLTDADGNNSEIYTSMNAVAGEWTFMSVPLADYSGIDKTAIKTVSLYEYWNGDYYIDDIIFTKEIPGDDAPPPVYSGDGVWFQTFENGTEGTYEASATGATAAVDAVGCEDSEGVATNGLVYEKAESASPEIADGSVLIKSAEPVDVSGLRYLVFYIKDTNGSNTLKVSLIDAEGNETDYGAAGWSELKTAKGEWMQYYVLIGDRTGAIDLTQVTGVRIGEWNAGTYYIDNVYFDNYLFKGEPVQSEDLPVIEAGKVASTVETGKYTEAQKVELLAEDGASIYYVAEDYTTPEEEKVDPTIDSEYLYEGILDITTTTTVKAISVKDGVAGDVCTFTYEIVPYPVIATSEPGTYEDQVVVEFRTMNDKDLIYYTIDGSTPARGEGTTVQFLKPMLVTESVSFNAVAYDAKSGSVTDVSAIGYTITDSGKTPAPVFSKPAGTYGAAIEVEINSDLDVYYTTDGSEPTTASTPYESAIAVEEDMTIRAIAVEDGVVSEVATAEYTFDSVATPFLRTDGKVLKDNYGTGDVITLRGTNAGGWLVTENWQCPVDAADQLSTLKVFTERFGAEKAWELINLYQDNWWTELDFDLAKEEGMNVLRLPITHFEMLNEDGSLKETAFDRLEWFVQNCEERGLYVLIDMHGAVGSQNGKDHSGDVTIPDVGDFYGNEENIQKTIALWEEIVERYKDNPWVCGYDLLNEPSAVGTPQFEVYDRIYDAIRAIDKNHVIYIQSIWEPNHLPDPSFYGWENVVYQYHFYGWDVEKDPVGQMEFIEKKVTMVNEETNYNVPLLVGEFTFFSEEESWAAMEIFEEQGWSYTSWTFKVTDGGEGSSWGIYTSGTSKVNISKDDEATIREKWSAESLNTRYFERNTEIADILKSYFVNNETNKPGTEAATGIEAKETLSLDVNATASVDAKIVPENTTYKAITYTSSNPAVATVDANGVVTAKAGGTATITIANLYGMTKECAVTVNGSTSGSGNEGTTGGSGNGGTTGGTGNTGSTGTVGGTGSTGGTTQDKVTAPGAVTGLKQTKSAKTSIKVAWDKVDKADGYEVSFKNGKKVTTKDVTKLNITFNKLKAGKVYTVTVKAYTKDGNTKLYGPSKKLTVTTQLKKKPASLKVTKTGAKKAKVTWKKVSGVTGYEVYMKTGKGAYKKVKTVKSASKTSFTKTKLKKGKTYTFKVRAYKKVGKTKVYSAYSTAKKLSIK